MAKRRDDPASATSDLDAYIARLVSEAPPAPPEIRAWLRQVLPPVTTTQKTAAA